MSQTTTNKSEYYIKGNPQVIKLLEKIAKEECNVETLQTRFSDGLDFHDIGVASLLSALHAAYYAGLNKGMQISHNHYDASFNDDN
jgi:hypothetical protein